jgi:hypothetical protein
MAKLITGLAAGLAAAAVLFAIGLVAGIPLAAKRGVSNYAGERAAWSLFYVALPLGVAGGIAGFLAGYYWFTN